jgi:hypothetical protein
MSAVNIGVVKDVIGAISMFHLKLTIMKKLLFALVMCTAAFAALAQDPAPAATPAPAQDQTASEQPIAASDLPAAITASLQGQDYTGWTVSNAVKKEKDGKTYYKVELKNGAETKTVKFDADGNKMKGKDKEKDKAVQ